MTTEEKLKELIQSRYKSIREFTQIIDMPYSTIDTIFKRGVKKASIDNIIKICRELHISADELYYGRIVPTFETAVSPERLELDALVDDLKSKILAYDDLTIDGVPLDPIARLTLVDALDTAVEVGKKKSVDSKILQRYAEYLAKLNEKK